MSTTRGGPGLSWMARDGGERLAASVRRRAGTGRAPGSVLIAVAAWLLNLGMIVFTLLALGLSRAGQSARAERALILACAAASSYMNVAAADVASPRSVGAYTVAPIALAVVVDRVVAAAAARIAGLVLLYCLRFALAAPETARGLRRMVLDAAPLPPVPETLALEATGPPRTKKAVLLALYRAHPDYGDRSRASRVAAELGLQVLMRTRDRRLPLLMRQTLRSRYDSSG